MQRLRRNYVPGGTYFFTLVTWNRGPFLTRDRNRQLLRDAFEHEQVRRPFAIQAMVLLPDHLHVIWTLPDGDSDFSTRWSRIKNHFTRSYLRSGGIDGQRSANRIRHRERAVWQHRFWEHTIRYDSDLKRCIDYIHWNPVKHGFVTRPKDYQWSTFQKWVDAGEYHPEWGLKSACEGDIPGAEWD